MKALIVDDDPHMRRAMERKFRVHGYEVTTAENGREALSLLENGLVPNVVLSDHDMPEMSGSELYRNIASNFPAIEPYFIMMSGSDRPRRIADEYGIPFLSKPFTDDELVHALTLVS